MVWIVKELKFCFIICCCVFLVCDNLDLCVHTYFCRKESNRIQLVVLCVLWQWQKQQQQIYFFCSNRQIHIFPTDVFVCGAWFIQHAFYSSKSAHCQISIVFIRQTIQKNKSIAEFQSNFWFLTKSLVAIVVVFCYFRWSNHRTAANYLLTNSEYNIYREEDRKKITDGYIQDDKVFVQTWKWCLINRFGRRRPIRPTNIWKIIQNRGTEFLSWLILIRFVHSNCQRLTFARIFIFYFNFCFIEWIEWYLFRLPCERTNASACVCLYRMNILRVCGRWMVESARR